MLCVCNFMDPKSSIYYHVINDEFQMLLYCKTFDSHRKTFLKNLKFHKNYWENENDTNKLNIILNPSEIHLILQHNVKIFSSK